MYTYKVDCFHFIFPDFTDKRMMAQFFPSFFNSLTSFSIYNKFIWLSSEMCPIRKLNKYMNKRTNEWIKYKTHISKTHNYKYTEFGLLGVAHNLLTERRTVLLSRAEWWHQKWPRNSLSIGIHSNCSHLMFEYLHSLLRTMLGAATLAQDSMWLLWFQAQPPDCWRNSDPMLNCTDCSRTNCTVRHHGIVVVHLADCKRAQNCVLYWPVAFDSSWDIDWSPSSGWGGFSVPSIVVAGVPLLLPVHLYDMDSMRHCFRNCFRMVLRWLVAVMASPTIQSSLKNLDLCMEFSRYW